MTHPQAQQNGHRIRGIRKERGLSRRALAELAGVKHEQTITNIELETRPAGLETLLKIADALDRDLVELVRPGTTVHTALTRPPRSSTAA